MSIVFVAVRSRNSFRPTINYSVCLSGNFEQSCRTDILDIGKAHALSRYTWQVYQSTIIIIASGSISYNY